MTTMNRRPPSPSLRYRTRLAVVPVLARLGRMIGVSWSRLGDALGREVLIAQVRRAAASGGKPSPTPAPAPAGHDVVFLTMIGGNAYNASVDVALALALKARGHRVRLVVCDRALPACEVKKSGQEYRWDEACGKCWAFGSAYFAAAGLDVITVSSLITAASPTEDTTEWGQYVEAALLKHLQVGSLEGQQAVPGRRADFSRAAAISAQVGRAVAAMRPTRVIMSHGIYCTWGPAMEILGKAGVPIVTYGKGKKRNTQKFNWDVSSDWWGVEAEWERIKDVELTPDERGRIEGYLRSRKDHSQDTLRYNIGAEEDVAETRRRFGLDPHKTTFTLFTNVLWDAASAQREIVFGNPIEWTIETIRWFAGRQDRQLIIKIHPAEAVIGTRQPFADIIRKAFPELPPNIRLIEPTAEVNSWSILKVTDLGLVHTSTVGMELPLEGVPVACVSRTHYRGKGFTIDVESKEAYFGLLDGWARGAADMSASRRLALRYAHLLFERYQLPWTCLYEPRHTDVRALGFSTIGELMEDETMRLVVNAIEQKGEFLLPRLGGR